MRTLSRTCGLDSSKPWLALPLPRCPVNACTCVVSTKVGDNSLHTRQAAHVYASGGPVQLVKQLCHAQPRIGAAWLHVTGRILPACQPLSSQAGAAVRSLARAPLST